MAAPVLMKERYELKNTIGQGGLGPVYKAYDRLLRRDVALKTLRDIDEPARADSFRRDCGILRALAHPNIVEILDASQTLQDGRTKLLFSMPLVEAPSLDVLLRTADSPLNPTQVVEIMTQAGKGLQAAHDRGILHCGLKPSNIFVGDKNSAQVADFGINRLYKLRPSKYAAPEQIKDEPLTNRSDVFSLGVICYEALTGRQPFSRNTEAETARAVAEFDPAPAWTNNPDVSRALAHTVARAMAKDPAERYESARAFVEALRNPREPAPPVRPASPQIIPGKEMPAEVSAIAARAHSFEERQMFDHALEEWLCVRDVKPDYPGLQAKIAKVQTQWIKQRQTAKQNLFVAVEAASRSGDLSKALGLLEGSQTEFADEPDFTERLEQLREKEKQGAESASSPVTLAVSSAGLEREVMQNGAQSGSREACLASLARLREELEETEDHTKLWDGLTKARALGARFPNDSEIQEQVTFMQEQVAALEAAATALEKDHVKESLEHCANILAYSPGHRLFQKLREDATRRYRELGDEYLFRVERWLASERNLDERERLLSRALEEFPDEAFYSEELSLVRDKKARVNAIAAGAHTLQDGGRFAEAIERWEELREIYPEYPELDDQIAGITQHGRRGRAETLLTEGREHLAAGRLAEGYQAVAEAAEALVTAPELLAPAGRDLATHAGDALRIDPRLAEAMVSDARRFDPAIAIPKELETKVQAARQQQDLEECLNAIDHARHSGDFEAGIHFAHTYLRQFPGNRQVEMLVRSLESEQEEAQRKAAIANDLGALRGVENDERQSPVNAEQVSQIAGRNPLDPDIRAAAQRALEFLATMEELNALRAMGKVSLARQGCRRALERFPGSWPLSCLRSDIENEYQAEAAEYPAIVRARLNAEPDWTKQTAILEQAHNAYPDEPYFTNELALIRQKQGALDAQVAKARELERKHFYAAAIREWEALHKSYSWYPNVEAELERLGRLRRQAKEDAVNSWIQRVEQAIAADDHEGAAMMIRQARQQLPAEQGFYGLEQKLRDAQKKNVDGVVLLAEGKNLLAEDKVREASERLYRAYSTLPPNKGHAEDIMELLLAAARTRKDQPEAVKQLTSTILRIEPEFRIPADLMEAGAVVKAIVSAPPPILSVAVPPPTPLAAEVEVPIVVQVQAPEPVPVQTLPPPKPVSLPFTQPMAVLAEPARATAESTRLAVAEPAAEFVLPKPVNPVLVPRTILVKKRSDRELFRPSIVLFLAFILAGIAAFIFFASRPSTDYSVAVEVNVHPDQVSVEVEGQTCVTPDCHLSLKPGKHIVHLSKEGFQPRTLTIFVRPGDSTPIYLSSSLEPLAGANQ